MNLEEYMSQGVRNIMAKAYRNVLTNPREARFAWHMQRVFSKSEGTRRQAAARLGVDVPPFLIASIATQCNLSCSGCYARKNGIAADINTHHRSTLTAGQWRDIMNDAAAAGINFCLVAGGEPLTRRDVLMELATVKNMIFPVFTNGTMLGPSYIKFLSERPNLVPVVSIEGDQTATDARRGQGVYRRAVAAMRDMKEAGLFYGASLTVTTENMEMLTSDGFVEQLRGLGCKIVFYVEYVPTDEESTHLALNEAESERFEAMLNRQRAKCDDMIVLSFPGDEKHMGGCLAAGRGFFHIAPDGDAEPCPFSPHSDVNVARDGFEAALRSPFFRRLREARLVGGPHTGGCSLYEHREEVTALLA